MCFKEVGRLANQWFDDVSQLFCHTICYGPPTGHYGPGGASFVDFGKAINLGEIALVRYSSLYFWLPSPPVYFMSLSVCISLYLILVVGSLLRTL